MACEKRALVCAPRMPEFDRECGSQRVWHLIGFLQESGWEVAFAAEHTAGAERYARALSQRGVPSYPAADASLVQLITTTRFDLALLIFWKTAERCLPLIRRLSPTTRVVVDSIDLHLLRDARRVFRRSSPAAPPATLGDKQGAEIIGELNAYAAADAVLAVSQKEADLINDLAADSGLARAVPLCEELPASPLPFDQRRGILFVGNFWHQPNVEAVEYLCRQIVPRLDRRVLAEHPVYVVGNALDARIMQLAGDVPDVRMVGWVPSIEPYFAQARISVVPLLHGAGTKGKLIRSLVHGTPCVSTSMGVEGLDVRDGEHVLVADDPALFADQISRLLHDEVLWCALAQRGRDSLAALHSPGVVRLRFLEVVSEVLRRAPKPAPIPAGTTGRSGKLEAYRAMIPSIRDAASRTLPRDATVLVVSRGDNALVQLDGCRGWHFPQVADGTYAGHHPADSAEAIDHLESLRARGAQFLLFPETAFWWLDHYADFRQHLEATYTCHHKDDNCVIYCLTPGTNGRAREAPLARVDTESLAKLRPVVPAAVSSRASSQQGEGKSVLVLGVYLSTQLSNAEDTIAVLHATGLYHVTQRWIALGGPPPSDATRAVTVDTVLDKVPKFRLINDLLSAEDPAQYEYIVVLDDDVVLPEHFLDHFLSIQDDLGFAIAQPARTSNSYIDLPIVERQRGVLARQTLFVEIGPVVSFHPSVYDLVFPFDLTAPMGWGYENIWSYRLAERGLKMGIIDAVPVDHSLRKPVSGYSWAEADQGRKALWRKHAHFPLDQCMRVLHAITEEEWLGRTATGAVR